MFRELECVYLIAPIVSVFRSDVVGLPQVKRDRFSVWNYLGVPDDTKSEETKTKEGEHHFDTVVCFLDIILHNSSRSNSNHRLTLTKLVEQIESCTIGGLISHFDSIVYSWIYCIVNFA